MEIATVLTTIVLNIIFLIIIYKVTKNSPVKPDFMTKIITVFAVLFLLFFIVQLFFVI